jgi:hypothetical protein
MGSHRQGRPSLWRPPGTAEVEFLDIQKQLIRRGRREMNKRSRIREPGGWNTRGRRVCGRSWPTLQSEGRDPLPSQKSGRPLSGADIKMTSSI